MSLGEELEVRQQAVPPRLELPTPWGNVRRVLPFETLLGPRDPFVPEQVTFRGTHVRMMLILREGEGRVADEFSRVTRMSGMKDDNL